MRPAFTTTSLEARYGETIALEHVDLVVPAATSLAVIGPNGSGKSTLLGALAGTIEPTGGELHVETPRPALVLQSTDVDNGLPLSVQDTVSLGRYTTVGLLRRFGQRDRDAVDRAINRMSIDDLATHQLSELSGGQRQRALIAQGLAQESDLLLLDEPFTGLDLTSRKTVLEVLDEQCADGRSVVMTTHDLDDARRCDQVLLLDTAPIAVGPPAEVLTHENLRRAFGGKAVQIGDELFLDDPHHH